MTGIDRGQQHSANYTLINRVNLAKKMPKNENYLNDDFGGYVCRLNWCLDCKEYSELSWSDSRNLFFVLGSELNRKSIKSLLVHNWFRIFRRTEQNLVSKWPNLLCSLQNIRGIFISRCQGISGVTFQIIIHWLHLSSQNCKFCYCWRL